MVSTKPGQAQKVHFTGGDDDASLSIQSTTDWQKIGDTRQVVFERPPYGYQVGTIDFYSAKASTTHDWLARVRAELIPGCAAMDYDSRYLCYVNWRQRVDFDVQESPDGGDPLLVDSRPSSEVQQYTPITITWRNLSWSWNTLSTSIRHELRTQGPVHVGWLKYYNDPGAPEALYGHRFEPAAEYQLPLGHRMHMDFYFSGVWGDNIRERGIDYRRYVGYILYPAGSW